jgi:PAS domain S-box-containing protein
MLKRSSVISVFFIWGLLLLLALAIVTIGLDIYSTHHNFYLRTDKIRRDRLREQKQIIRREVERVVEMINHQIAQSEEKAKRHVERRTHEAYNVIRNIYEQNKSSKSDVEIKKLIKDALRPMRFNYDRGYYFIASMAGECILYPIRPRLEGTSIINLQDSRGEYSIKKEIALMEIKDEGVIVDYWPKPKSDSKKDFKKITFIKKFAPYDWYVGTGVYVDDIEDELKKRLMEQLNKISFGKNGYMFAGDWTGTTLANGAQPYIIGINIWNSEDCRGNKLAQALIAASKNPSGDYVNYWWRKPDTGKESPKIAYAKGIPKWKMFVATGLYADDIEPEIAVLQDELNKEVKGRMFRLGLILAGTVILFACLLLLLKKRLQKDFNLFISFFDRAAYSDEEIKLSSVKFNEFRQLAGYANKMLNDKNRAQLKLRDEQEEHSITLYSIGDGVITTDTSGRIKLLNGAAEKMTGWLHKEAVGRPLSEVFNIINDESREPISNYAAMALKGKYLETGGSHTVLIAKNGIEYNISDNVTPVRDSRGKICGSVFVFRDITEKQRVEEELFKARKMESIGILAGGIAHDFNNIMTGLFGNISLAKNSLPKETKAREYLETASHALDRAVDLTGQLLTFAKGGEPLKKPIDIHQIISQSVKFNLNGSNVRAILTLPESLWHVNADKGQLSQVMNNLIINAKQAMAGGGTLYIEGSNIEDFKDNSVSKLSGNCVKITIRDEGTGISAKYLKNIFDPYFTTKQEGSGLGLATSFSIIFKHNGHISVDSKLGVGSIFTLYLPAVNSCRTENESEVLTDEKVAPAVHILVMDDKKMVRDVLETMLTLSGSRVKFADNGKTAIEQYRTAMQNQDPFDVVLMDLSIPGGMGGKEAAEKIIELDSKAKIIVSSGYSNDPVMADFEAYGFKGRLVKPFQMESLMLEISRVIMGGF